MGSGTAQAGEHDVIESLLLDSEIEMEEPDHFGSRFMEYATDRSAVSARQALFLGLALVASVVRRRLAIGFAHGRLYTTLWAFLLAPSGEGHKSTLLNLAEDVLAGVDPLVSLPHEFSLAGLLTELAAKERKDQQGGSMGLFIKDEAAGFLASLEKLDFQTGAKDVLLNLNNSPDRYVKKLKAERLALERVYVNLLLVGVPSRLVQAITATDWYSGFMARMAVVLPEGPIPWRDVTFAATHQLEARDALTAELRLLDKKLRGATRDVRLNADVLDRYNRYGHDLDAARRDAPEELGASYERFPELALRLGTLIAVTTQEQTRKGPLVVPMEALVAGIRHAEEARQDAHRLFELYSGVADEADIAKLVELVGRSPRITRRTLQQNSHMRASAFNAAFNAAINAGRIAIGPDNLLYVPG